MSHHIHTVNSKVRKHCGLLNLVKRSLTPRALKALLLCFSLSSSYCHAVWGGCSGNMLKPLLTSQKKVIRVISNLNKYDHTNDFYKLHNILKMPDLNMYYIATFVYKSLNNISRNSIYFNHSSNDRYLLRNAGLLQLPHFNLHNLKRLFCIKDQRSGTISLCK